jgi:hypothetical protein
VTAQPFEFRAGAPSAIQANRFGPLTELAGTWVGKGFNLISKPGFQLNLPFVLQVNATMETLSFTPIGGQIPDRGSQQNDINVFGMTYTQEVTDAASLSLLHVERGMWINVPPSTQPSQPQTVARLSTIPHGDSVLAQGNGITVNGVRPTFPIGDPTPFIDGVTIPPGYFPPDPFQAPQVNPFPLPDGFDLSNVNTPLAQAIADQTISEMVVLQVSTATPPQTQELLQGPFGGGVLNIPFVTTNANAVSLDAVFWIETIVPPASIGGDSFLQLQYTQTVILSFPAAAGPIGPNNPLINWPHISVATLIKQ